MSRDKTDHLATARAAWGDDMPEWVRALAETAAASTQRVAGDRIGYSGSTVSQVISNTYRGDIPSLEIAVRGALLAETVDCPILGEMTRDVCLNWQKRPFSTASSNAVRMYQTCRSGKCSHSRLKPED